MAYRISDIRDIPPSLRAYNPHIAPPQKPEPAKPRKVRASKPAAGYKLSALEAQLLGHLELAGFAPLFEREARFHPTRRWRLDFLDREHSLGIEVHGSVFTGGRHTRGKGFTADREKLNAAAEAGITVLEFTGGQVADGSALAQITRMLEARGWRRLS